MSVRKIISILSLLVLSLSVYGQSARQSAQRLFASGQYGDAATLCNGAAATASSSERTFFYGLSKKCEKCAALKAQGAKQFSSGNYTAAKGTYESLLSLNPSDSEAKAKLSRCNTAIGKAADKKAKAQKHKAEYDAAVASGDFSSYAAKYPEEEGSRLFFAYDPIRKAPEKILSKTELDVCIRTGMFFRDAGNKTAASEAFDRAILFGDADAMCQKAQMFLDDENLTDAVKLLAVASFAENDKPAKEKLAQIENDYTVNYVKPVAGQYYKALTTWTESPNSALYILTNIRSFPIDNVTPVRKVEKQVISSMTPEELSGIDDTVLYELAMKLYDGQINARLFMLAASKGNVAALTWLASSPEYKDTEDAKIFKKCVDIWQDIYFQEYVKYLKGDKNIDWYKVYNCIWGYGGIKGMLNRNDALYTAFMYANTGQFSKYRFKWFRSYIEQYKGQPWDETVVNECRASLCQGKYYKKLLKILNGLPTEKNLYDQNDNLFRKYAILGWFDSIHEHHKPKDGSCQEQSLAVSVVKKLKTSASATAKGVMGKKVTYSVGEDLGFGYVYSVEDNGRKVCVVLKKTWKTDGKDRFRFRFPEEYRNKWDNIGLVVPNADDLSKIYKALFVGKRKYPEGAYLTWEGTVYKSPKNGRADFKPDGLFYFHTGDYGSYNVLGVLKVEY